MINYKRISIQDKQKYENALNDGYSRGCEYSFSNLFMWGEQGIAELDGQITLLSRFGERYLYPFPIGTEDKRRVLDAVISDSRERGIPCIISGISEEGKALIESLYPGSFEFTTNDGSYDYVYFIDDLADLTGRKYASKRNHCRRFIDSFPEARTVRLTKDVIPAVRKMAETWFADRTTAEEDFFFERKALERAFDNYEALGLEGLALMDGEEVLAFTAASRMSADTFDVHFEKAVLGADGAYAVINKEFAGYIREKYPEVRYLDREEDMGLPGLRKAKQSYHPHHQVVKYKARLLEK